MFQMLLNPLSPIHLQSGSNTPNAYTGHLIKGVLTIPNMTHTSDGLFVARRSADYGEQKVQGGLRASTAQAGRGQIPA